LNGRLSETRLGSGDIAPLLDNGLLDLPWVRAGPGADLLGDVNALLSRLQEWHQLGDMLALPLWLKVASLLRNLLDNGLLLVKALLWARLQLTARWATELTWDLLTLSLRRVLLDILLLRLADLLGPLGTLLLGGVSLGDILALLLLDGLTSNNIILNIVLVVTGLALRLVDGLTLLRALSVTDQGSVAELDLLIRSNLLVLNEAVLDEVLLALLLLLRLEVSGVGGVTLLAVAMLALNDVIVLGLLNHDDLVDTPLSSSSDGSNVKSDIIATTLAGATGWQGKANSGFLVLMMMVVVMLMVSGMPSVGVGLLVEWEGSPQVLSSPVGASS